MFDEFSSLLRLLPLCIPPHLSAASFSDGLCIEQHRWNTQMGITWKVCMVPAWKWSDPFQSLSIVLTSSAIQLPSQKKGGSRLDKQQICLFH